ncbi:MAG: exopolysaccharide biosynthesis polyprenyl glycosylphosphotransferase, partial [SAR324 cluster bacterium]|nr:exopolysaccharide biosynthesis polyprenyl glycosylphosphotransferase [SAR324 cluster bacterium]
RRELGIQLIGCLSKDGTEKRGPGNVPIMGSYDDLGEVLRSRELDQVIVALPLEDNHILPNVMKQLRDSTVDVKIIPDVYQFISVGGSIEDFEGLPVISVQESPIEGVNLLLKRCIDIGFSALSLIILFPLMLTIAILIKISSRGPVLYKQERMSIDGSRFCIYKFRTMSKDAEAHGPQWSTTGDSRVTFLGRILRAYSLDELPQLYNVLRGDMSLVGPRPERPVFINEFRKHIPKYMLRHKVPAGMTGWAQINGWRGNTSIDKRVECDLFYIRNWSILFDLKIVLLTLFKGLRNRSA